MKHYSCYRVTTTTTTIVITTIVTFIITTVIVNIAIRFPSRSVSHCLFLTFSVIAGVYFCLFITLNIRYMICPHHQIQSDIQVDGWDSGLLYNYRNLPSTQCAWLWHLQVCDRIQN